MRSTNQAAPARRTLRRGLAMTAALPLMLAAAGCASGTTSGGGQPDPTTTDAAVTTAACGTLPDIAPADPEGAIASLAAEVQPFYNGNPYPTLPSYWADWAPEGPLTVAYVSLPMLNAWSVSAKAQMEESFAEAKAAGLVEGELLEFIMSDPANMTPAEQIGLYEEAVRQGADLIYLVPLSGEAIAASVDAAAEQGIPTITQNGYVPSDKAVNWGVNPYLDSGAPAAEILGQLDGTGNVVIVRGVIGLATDTYGYAAIESVLANCPNVTVLGEVEGGFNPPAAKTALQQFLASHPQQLDAVLQVGVMGQGVYQALFESGRTPIAKVSDTGASAGSLAGWAEAIERQPDYTAAGTGGTGRQQVALLFEIGMRMAAGEGVKVSNLTYASPLLTNDSFGEWMLAGADLNSPDETADGAPLMSEQELDAFFTNPGLLASR